MCQYDSRSSKFIQQPFMTLSVAVVGKFECDYEMGEKEQTEVYKIDLSDPGLTQSQQETQKEKDKELDDRIAFIMKSSGRMIIEPYMEDLPDLFKSYFVNILRVGYKIPRLEHYLTKSNIT